MHHRHLPTDSQSLPPSSWSSPCHAKSYVIFALHFPWNSEVHSLASLITCHPSVSPYSQLNSCREIARHVVNALALAHFSISYDKPDSLSAGSSTITGTYTSLFDPFLLAHLRLIH